MSGLPIPEYTAKEQEEKRAAGADPKEYLKHPVVVNASYRLAYQGVK